VVFPVRLLSVLAPFSIFYKKFALALPWNHQKIRPFSFAGLEENGAIWRQAVGNKFFKKRTLSQGLILHLLGMVFTNPSG
jgi:hypothetical protein